MAVEKFPNSMEKSRREWGSRQGKNGYLRTKLLLCARDGER
jgi:hypothetical protein